MSGGGEKDKGGIYPLNLLFNMFAIAVLYAAAFLFSVSLHDLLYIYFQPRLVALGIRKICSLSSLSSLSSFLPFFLFSFLFSNSPAFSSLCSIGFREQVPSNGCCYSRICLFDTDWPSSCLPYLPF